MYDRNFPMKAKRKIRKRKINRFAKIRWMKPKVIITARTLQCDSKSNGKW